MIYGNDEARSRWFDTNDISWTEVIVPRSRIPISGTVVRNMMAEDNYKEWFKWTSPKMHKFYPDLRARLMAIEYYKNKKFT